MGGRYQWTVRDQQGKAVAPIDFLVTQELGVLNPNLVSGESVSLLSRMPITHLINYTHAGWYT